MRLNVTAPDPAWIRFKSVKPDKFSLNGRDDKFYYDEATGMVWAQARAGKTEILVS